MGKGKFLEDIFGSSSAGGKSASFGDEESISGNTHRGVVMKPAPPSAFEMAKTDFLFQFMIIALNAPAHHREIDHSI